MTSETDARASHNRFRRTRSTKKAPRPGALQRKEERVALLFLLPWFAGLIAFLLIPLGWAIWISLSSDRLLKSGKFIGLSNYHDIFTQDNNFYHALFITLKWLVLTTPLFLFVGMLLSLLLNQKIRGMNFFRTLLYIPAVLSGVAVAVLWLQLLNPDLGAVNYVLRQVGVSNPPYWLQSPTWAMPAAALMGLWGVGGTAVIYLAGLQNIPPHLYEAASIDGAGPLSKFRYITLPMLSPTIFFLMINALIDSLLVFGPIFVLSAGSQGGGIGGPDDSLLFYMIYLYRSAFEQGQLGYGSALAWILTVIGCLIVYIMFRLEKRFVYYEAQG